MATITRVIFDDNHYGYSVALELSDGSVEEVFSGGEIEAENLFYEWEGQIGTEYDEQVLS